MLSVIQSIEKVVVGGLFFILVGTSLAFGSVHTITYGAIQTLVFFNFFLWGIRGLLIRSSLHRLNSAEKQNGTFFLRYPFFLPFAIWIGLVLFQLVPLRTGWLGFISQETLRIYQALLGTLYLGAYPTSLSPFDTWRALLQVLACAVLFYLVVTFPRRGDASRNSPTRDQFLNAFLFAAVLTAGFQAFYSLAEYYWTGNQRIFFFPRTLPTKGAAGTFVNPNHFAGYLLLFFPLLFSWVILLLPRSRSREGVHSFRGQGLLLTLLLIGVEAGLVLSHSRMGLFSFLVEALLLVLGFFFLGAPKQALGLFFVLLTGALGLLVFLDPEFSKFQRSLPLFFQWEEAGRFRFWRDCFQMVKDFPWLGTGLGTFQLIFPKYSTVPILSHLNHAHNDWLELLVETGFLGFGLIALALAWFFAVFVKRLRKSRPVIRILGLGILVSLVGFMTHSVAEFNFHIPASAYSFALILGLAVRLGEISREEP